MNAQGIGKPVNFRGRECTIEFIQLEGSPGVDICLFDAKTSQPCFFCTLDVENIDLKPNQMLIKPDVIDLLTDAGIVGPTGRQIDSGRYGALVVSEQLVGPMAPAWNPAELSRNEPQRRADNRAIRDQLDSFFELDAVERNRDDRDLGDEFEL
jgi:hypothetical protein